MKGFKGFDKDLKCNGYQYEVGKEFKTEKAELCSSGFHFCENPFDVFSYYAPAESRFGEVEGDGEVIKQKGGDSKAVCTHIKIHAEISLKGIIEAGVKFILDRVDWKNKKESNTGDQSAATNTGNYSAATNTGYKSAATNTGNYSAATNTGYQSSASVEGKESIACVLYQQF